MVMKAADFRQPSHWTYLWRLNEARFRRVHCQRSMRTPDVIIWHCQVVDLASWPM